MDYYSLFLWFILCLPLVWYVFFYSSRKRLYELAALIPGLPNEVPLLGNALHFYGNNLDISRKCIKVGQWGIERGGVLKVWIGPVLYICIGKPRDVEIVLNKELKRGVIYRFLKPWVGEGLVSCLDVSVWKRHRKIIQATFHQKVLDSFLDVFVENCEIMIKKLSNASGTFSIMDYIGPCTVDFICESAMGVKVNAQTSMETPFIKASEGISKIIYRRMFQVWLHSEWIYKFTASYKEECAHAKAMHDFTDNIIRVKKQQFYNKSKNIEDDENDSCNMSDIPMTKRKAFLDMLIEQSDVIQWTNNELRDEVDTMMSAGNDTTAQTASFAIMLLGLHPDAQDKAFEELDDIFGDSDRTVTKEDLSKMKYIERVIKESLRLFPIAPIVVRSLENEVKIDDYTLPSGVDCIVGIHVLHRDRTVWGEKADEFDPDNFLPEKCAGRHPYSYIPFGRGPRNCIGIAYAMMAIKVVLATILRRYKIYSTADYKNMDVIWGVVQIPVIGYPITIEPRFPIHPK